MSVKTCKTCGALVKKPQRHKNWHKMTRPIPGPPGPVGPQGVAGSASGPNVSTTYEDALASLKKFGEAFWRA